MPWSVSSPMSRRLEFVEDARRALYSMTELCARYGISRRVGYKWLARFEAAGVDGLADQRRAAKTHPHRMAEEYVGLEEVADGVWSVYFGPVLLGRFDERDLRILGAHNRNKLKGR